VFKHKGINSMFTLMLFSPLFHGNAHHAIYPIYATPCIYSLLRIFLLTAFMGNGIFRPQFSSHIIAEVFSKRKERRDA
jgi:hypothetical protein